MKSNWCFIALLFLLALCVSSSHGQTKKVLVIGVDGIRPDAMEVANTPNIDALIANGTYSRNATTSDLTFSGPGWTDILFGIHRNLHGVATNSTSTNPNNPAFQIFSGSNQHQFNDLLAIAKNADPGLFTARWTTWLPLHTTRTPGGTDYTFFHDYTSGGDDAAAADAASYYGNNDADFGFFYFSDVDVAGHNFGFNPSVAGYRNEIESTDALIGQFVAAIQNRPGYLNGTEDWIFILTSDHGGNLGGGHSGNDPWQREVPFIVSGNSVQNQLLGYDAKNVDVVATALAHLEISAPGVLAGHAVGLNGIPDPRPAIAFEQNLIFNGDAEYDQGFTTNGMDQAVTGWNEFPDANFFNETSSRSGSQSITVLQYGSPGGFPTVAGPGPTDRGDNFFSPGSALGQSGTSLMRQTIDVTELAASIDANLVYVELSAFLGGYLTQQDKANLVARFYAADGVSLLSEVIVSGPSASQRSNTTGLFFRHNSDSVIAGTRLVEIELQTIGNDGYADNLSCVLTTTPPPPPPAISPVCLYEFQDSGNLGAATIGNDLVINNSNGTIASVPGISSIAGDLAASVGVRDSFSLGHGILANNGGAYVNQYTVVYDVFVPASSDGTWRSLLQTNLDNSNDGDYYVRDSDNFIGVAHGCGNR